MSRLVCRESERDLVCTLQENSLRTNQRFIWKGFDKRISSLWIYSSCLLSHLSWDFLLHFPNSCFGVLLSKHLSLNVNWKLLCFNFPCFFFWINPLSLALPFSCHSLCLLSSRVWVQLQSMLRNVYALLPLLFSPPSAPLPPSFLT